MSRRISGKVLVIHLGIIALLLVAQFFLSPYHHINVARIMIFAAFALGYNVLLGYTGLLSLGHAMFFAAGVYGAGLPVFYLQFNALEAFATGVVSSFLLGVTFGLIVIRTSGVSFLIVTLMFAQAAFLTTLYFNEITLGDQGIVISQVLPPLEVGGAVLEFSDPDVKYNAALLLFGITFLVCIAIVYSPIGRVFVAIRENEARTRMLGYNTYKYKLVSLVISATISGAAGAMYALLFSYIGSTFASIEYSIFPLLWTLVGGMGTLIGPVLGTGLMFYLVDIASGLTESHLIVVGIVLVVLVLYFPKGLMGTIREKWLPWLP
ncbi:MAG: branched-chain amino acid ABC transporter permease [Alphaproteobacteria bacterium]|nr:branched-chain amino acid ABC transporter permease [Alphaproteobacteria bacterium]MCY4497967.1 branched-chain amino acid ABC transporter permease [Rhodospirillaceae bacterium]